MTNVGHAIPYTSCRRYLPLDGLSANWRLRISRRILADPANYDSAPHHNNVNSRPPLPGLPSPTASRLLSVARRRLKTLPKHLRLGPRKKTHPERLISQDGLYHWRKNCQRDGPRQHNRTRHTLRHLRARIWNMWEVTSGLSSSSTTSQSTRGMRQIQSVYT